MDFDEVCAEAARAIGVDVFVVRQSVTSWLARAAEVLDEEGVIDLAELGRILKITLEGDGEQDETITIHRPYLDPMRGYHGIRFDQHTKLGPIQPLSWPK